MILQKQTALKRKGKEYYKFVVILSQTDIEKAEFKPGQNLNVTATKGKIILKN